MTTEKTAHPHALGLFAGLAIFFFFLVGHVQRAYVTNRWRKFQPAVTQRKSQRKKGNKIITRTTK